ncbi:MAG TPA: glycosyl hydrolase 53 family protein [Gemmatimonadales bacterium]|nr:glycosyl hydrolase 53 family protein [Gemmatimonadales bacterium]
MRARALLVGLADVVGCHESSSAPVVVRLPARAFVGGDISALARIEQAGGVFRDGGQAGDAIAILRAHGSNGFRLRLFVNPNDSDVVVNDLPYTVALARRVKAAGAKLLLDFHYSDTWADPGHQTTPAAWAGLSLDSLERTVETYTAGVMAQLERAGALPDIVQVGNEIDSGMLWPLGELYVTGADTLTEWNQFTALLKAAIRGVRDSLAPGDSVRIMLHYSLGGNSGGTQWFFDHMGAYGVPYDVIGLSYYPFWHGAMVDLQSNLWATATRYGKDIVVVETTYPWRTDGWQSMVTNGAGMSWPATPQGQASYLQSLVTTVAGTPNGHGAGVVWWYPEAIEVPGLFIWGGGSLCLFDTTGNVLPAASALAAP